MRLRVLLVLLILFSVNFSNKVSGRSDYSDNLFYGGYLGLEIGFGNVNQYEISPLLGYKITPWLHGGLGAKYLYFHDKSPVKNFRGHIYGPVIFADIIALENINNLFSFPLLDAGLFLHGEMNFLNLPAAHFDIENNHPGSKRFFRETWLVGAGLRREAGESNHFHLLFMVDVSPHSNPVYSRLLLRFGFMF